MSVICKRLMEWLNGEVEGFGMAGVVVFSGSCPGVYMEGLGKVTKKPCSIEIRTGHLLKRV